MGLTINQPNNKYLIPTKNPVFGAGTIETFFASDTFTLPTGVKAVKVRVWGAGGGGTAGQSGTACSGGGGGGYAELVISSPNATYTVTIGAGGQPAIAGGTSSFGSACSATGGAEGSYTTGGAGGTGSSGNINRTGGIGGACASSNSVGGGGSAAGPWGNGFGGGGARVSRISYGGGGGIGGTGGGGNIQSSTESIQQAYGGGGAFGRTTTANGGPGNGIPGQPAVITLITPSTSQIHNQGAGLTATATQGVMFSTTIGRFLGDIVEGTGGAAAFVTSDESPNSAKVHAIAGNGGPGGGGGAAAGGGGVGRGGNGGVFGGGGGGYNSGGTTGQYTTGGNGGIGGGGAGTLNYNSGYSGGCGGSGLVVVEY